MARITIRMSNKAASAWKENRGGLDRKLPVGL
jgi:hypothetical protein